MILVSGGSGLVGSYLLIDLLKKGERVRAIYRNEKSLEKTKRFFSIVSDLEAYDKVEWMKADLLDITSLEKCFEGVEYVYHCAAVVSFQKSQGRSMIETNVDGTANMVNLALDKKVKKFCFVSSVAALGKYRDGSCADENTLWQKEVNTSDYSISKFYSENEVWRASEEGLNCIIVNPSTIIGFGDWDQSSNSLFKRIAEGLSFYTSGSTGFVSVEDVVKSMIQLMESEWVNERYVLSSENLSFKDLFQMIAQSLGKKAPAVLLQKWQAKIYVTLLRVLSLFTRKAPKITMANVHSAFNQRCFNSQKIELALNFDFEKIETAIQRSGRLYKENY